MVGFINFGTCFGEDLEVLGVRHHMAGLCILLSLTYLCQVGVGRKPHGYPDPFLLCRGRTIQCRLPRQYIRIHIHGVHG